jgi:hypothetical protein
MFKSTAEFAKKYGKTLYAKTQVCCSHEVASVPYIPVPGNLFDKYKAMHALGVKGVMQCWYFGNYPSLMNKAAGELAFLNDFSDKEAFLELEKEYAAFEEFFKEQWGITKKRIRTDVFSVSPNPEERWEKNAWKGLKRGGYKLKKCLEKLGGARSNAAEKRSKKMDTVTEGTTLEEEIAPIRIMPTQDDEVVPVKLETAQDDEVVPVKLETAQDDEVVPVKLEIPKDDEPVRIQVETLQE